MAARTQMLLNCGSASTWSSLETSLLAAASISLEGVDWFDGLGPWGPVVVFKIAVVMVLVGSSSSQNIFLITARSARTSGPTLANESSSLRLSAFNKRDCATSTSLE